MCTIYTTEAHKIEKLWFPFTNTRNFPITIQYSLHEKVCLVLIDLPNFFKDLCCKVLQESDFDLLEYIATSNLSEMGEKIPRGFLP